MAGADEPQGSGKRRMRRIAASAVLVVAAPLAFIGWNAVGLLDGNRFECAIGFDPTMPAGEFRGSVKDRFGGPVQNAVIYLLYDSGGSSAVTNASGEFHGESSERVIEQIEVSGSDIPLLCMPRKGLCRGLRSLCGLDLRRRNVFDIRLK